jgi:hypothetical protein
MLVTRSTLFAGAVAGLLLAAPSRVEAQTLVTTPFGGFATSLTTGCPSGYCLGLAPTSVGFGGHDVTLSSITPYHLVSSGSYSLGTNGLVEGDIWATVNGSEGALAFDFESPVTAVGAFMNYRPGPGNGTPWLEAWNGSVMLGQWNLAIEAPISTPSGYNQFAFRGVEYAGGITRLVLSGGYLLTKDLRATSAAAPVPVPEPETLALLAMGGFVMALVPRRRRTA